MAPSSTVEGTKTTKKKGSGPFHPPVRKGGGGWWFTSNTDWGSPRMVWVGSVDGCTRTHGDPKGTFLKPGPARYGKINREFLVQEKERGITWQKGYQTPPQKHVFLPELGQPKKKRNPRVKTAFGGSSPNRALEPPELPRGKRRWGINEAPDLPKGDCEKNEVTGNEKTNPFLVNPEKQKNFVCRRVPGGRPGGGGSSAHP